MTDASTQDASAVSATPSRRDRPDARNPTIAGHGSPAGELLPSDQPATTTGPTRDAIAQWQKDAAGRAVTQAAPVVHRTPQKKGAAPVDSVNPSAAAAPTPAGPGSRDTPPPTGEAAAAGEGVEDAGHAKSADKPAKAPPSETRPPRPTPQTADRTGPAEGEPTVASAGSARSAVRAGDADQDALVEAITRRLAENLAKALHQSIVEAVQGAGPAPRPPDASDVAAGKAAQVRVGES